MELWEKAVEINNLFKRFCRNRGWPFLPNENIDSSCLNRSGPHLNSKGASKLSKTVLTHISNHLPVINTYVLPSRSANDHSLESTNENEIYSFLPSKRGIKIANLNINYSVRSDLNVPELENLCTEIRKPRSRPFFVVTWLW